MNRGRSLNLTADLAAIPQDLPSVLLLRHAERPPLTQGEPGDHLEITPKGSEAALQLGAALAGRLGAIVTSPVRRCVSTASQIAQGAGYKGPPQSSPELGDPGCFIANPDEAWKSFLAFGNEGVFNAQLNAPTHLKGFRETGVGVKRLLDALPDDQAPSGIHLWCTHDSIVGVAGGHLLGWSELGGWPNYLDGIWLWREDRGIVMRAFGEIRTLKRGAAA